MEDCYYFLYSNCSKPNCEFRHNLNAKENPILCKTWKLKKQCKIDCPFRHSTYHLNKKRHEMMCYWETTTGCTKQFCEFRHEDVQKDMWKESRVKSLNEIIGRKSNVEENRRNEHEEDLRDDYGIEMQRNELHNDRREEPAREMQKSELQYDRRDDSNFEPQISNKSKMEIQRNAVNGDGNQIGNVFDAQRRDFTSSHKKSEERHAKGNESVYARHAFAKRKNNRQPKRNESNYADEEWNLQEELLLTANDANKTFGPDTIPESSNEQKREDSSIMQIAQEHTANTSNSHTNNPSTSFFVESTVVSTQTLDVDESVLEIESDAIINKLKTGKRRIEDSSTTKRLKWREKIELLERNLKAAKKKSICTIKDAIEDGEKE